MVEDPVGGVRAGLAAAVGGERVQVSDVAVREQEVVS